MIEEPAVVLRCQPASEWSATGPLAERALEFARRFAGSTSVVPQRLDVMQAPPEHCGLGVGTQLGLAVAKALAVVAGHPEWSGAELAGRVGRGVRSAVGAHGFDRGGLIVEAGKLADEAVSPLVVREELPGAWRVVVMLADIGRGLHGPAEQSAFDKLAMTPTATEALCRLVLLGLLPAVREADCQAFGEALYDFNARVGELFAQAQGGRYAHGLCAELVELIRGLGVAGVGQSSWGPAVFAVVEDDEQGRDVLGAVRKKHGASVQLWLTRSSAGAVVSA
jgi:beta-RFAP synthase